MKTYFDISSTTFHKKDLMIERRYITNNYEHLNLIHQKLSSDAEKIEIIIPE